jgi:hypothetical protein
LSKINFLHNIKDLNEGKYMFTSLALVIGLVVLVLLLDSYNRRHLLDLETRNRDLERKLGALQDEVKELRCERERREVVLRKEIGKAREEVMGLGKELGTYQKNIEKQREVDRSVDMEEKLCLIRGLKEIAGERGIETESESGGEKLVGLGIRLGSVGSDEDAALSSSGEEDEAETLRLKTEGEEAWEKFEQVFMRNNGELGQEESEPLLDSTDHTDDLYDPSPEILVDLQEESPTESSRTPETQGERLFPAPPREFLLVSRKTNGLRSFTDPSVQAQFDGLFELE